MFLKVEVFLKLARQIFKLAFIVIAVLITPKVTDIEFVLTFDFN